MASGTFAPYQGGSSQGISAEDVLAGKKLYNVHSWGKKTCASCHEKAKPISRSKMVQLGQGLVGQINICISKPDRGGGKSLAKTNAKLKQLVAYLTSRFRLSHTVYQGLTQ